MPCYSPLTAFQTGSGEIIFSEHKSKDVRRELQLACGQCIGCKLERARQRAVRCMHEARMHEQNSFITLTYSDEHLPRRGQLEYRDFQLFMKRLRKHTGPDRVRFYMGGEYGTKEWRPHFHACIFGYDWPDKKFYKTNGQGDQLYTSDLLEHIWGKGFAPVGEVTFESAGYIARYCTQKRTGALAELWYYREDEEGPYQLTPEFNRMSLKPGLGAGWFDKYKDDVIHHDHVIVRGKETRVPKYYDQLLERIDPDRFAVTKEEREANAAKWATDNTPARLKAKEEVTRAAIRALKRTI